MVALREVRRIAGGVDIEAGSEFEISIVLVEMCGDRFAPRDVLIDLIESRRQR